MSLMFEFSNCRRKSGEVSIKNFWLDNSMYVPLRVLKFLGFLGSQSPKPQAREGTPGAAPEPKIIIFDTFFTFRCC